MRELIKNNPIISAFSLILTLIAMHTAIGAIGNLPSYYTVITGIGILCILFFSEFPKLYTPILLFLVYIGFALLLSDPSPIFNAWARFFAFVAIITIVSPMIQNENLRILRRLCLYEVITLCIILSFISFFCFFLGINYMTYEANAEFTDKGGLFSGMTNHSIMLGIISGISVCVLLYKSITSKWIWVVPMIPCLGSLALSASRGALIATIIASIVIMLMSRRCMRNMGRIWFVAIAVLCISAYAVTNTNIMDGFISKVSERDEISLFDAREHKIKYRIEEFKSSPIIGVGFSTVDPTLGDAYNSKNGTIEPGSSWFAILSMTGIVGLLLCLGIFFQAILTQWRERTYNSILLLGLFAFFAVSFASEGYIFAAGSPLCFIFWLLLGNCIDRRYEG